jgi:hypothetical protein
VKPYLDYKFGVLRNLSSALAEDLRESQERLLTYIDLNNTYILEAQELNNDLMSMIIN